MAKLFANGGDPDQMLHSVVSDLGLHCLAITILGVFRLQHVNIIQRVYKQRLRLDCRDRQDDLDVHYLHI